MWRQFLNRSVLYVRSLLVRVAWLQVLSYRVTDRKVLYGNMVNAKVIKLFVIYKIIVQIMNFVSYIDKKNVMPNLFMRKKKIELKKI